MNRKFKPSAQRPVYILLLIGCLLCLWGCQSTEQLTPVKSDPAENQIGAALAIYRTGNYEKAAELFNTILMNTHDDDVARQALYGLACAQIMLADSSVRYREAYGLWQTWYGLPAQIPPWEDPRLLGPVFDKLLFPGRERTSPPNDDAPSGTQNEPVLPVYPPGKGDTSADAMMTPEERDLYRSLIRIKEEENNRLTDQLEKIAGENRSLKQQLKAIEEIHQEINQKKKGLQQP